MTDGGVKPPRVDAASPPAAGTTARGRPWWAIAGLAAIAVLALALYTWSLSRNGMANTYYAAAVKSATLSWKAFFFGCLDPGSFITVDKPPAALWLMALSGRLFGFSSWSMLVPQALAGVGAVVVLHHLVRRWRGEGAALLAALAFALTPVAALIFRYNNPDALLTLLLLLAAWAVWSATDNGSTWRLAAAGVALGFAFLTKMLMVFLVAPAFVVVFLACGPARLGRRLLQLVVAMGALIVSAGWWMATVELWPEATRPHVGGTSTDSWIDLFLGRSAGILDGGVQGANLSGAPSLLRMFNEQLGGQVAWLLPLALLGLVVGIVVTRRTGRTDRMRAGYLLWGLWTLTMVAVFSSASGTLHSYYTVVLAPAVAALAGAGCVEMWQLGRRNRQWAWLLSVGIIGSAVWSAVLLVRVDGYAPGLSIAVLALGVVAAAGLLLIMLGLSTGDSRRTRRVASYVFVGLAGAALLAGPLAYVLSTIERSVGGATAAAGPATSGPGARIDDGSASSVDQGLIDYLTENRGDARYLVAVQTTTESVPIILATYEAVVTIGGYKNRDPVPTVAELEAMVRGEELRFVYLTSERVRSSSQVGTVAAGETSTDVTETLQAVVDWVVAEGIVVDPVEYGGTPGSPGSSEGTLYSLF